MNRCRNCANYRPMIKFRPYGYCTLRCYKSLDKERELKDYGIIEEKTECE